MLYRKYHHLAEVFTRGGAWMKEDEASRIECPCLEQLSGFRWVTDGSVVVLVNALGLVVRSLTNENQKITAWKHKVALKGVNASGPRNRMSDMAEWPLPRLSSATSLRLPVCFPWPLSYYQMNPHITTITTKWIFILFYHQFYSNQISLMSFTGTYYLH